MANGTENKEKEMRKVKQKLHEANDSVTVFPHKFRSSSRSSSYWGTRGFQRRVGFYANVNDTLSASLKTFLSRLFVRHVLIFLKENSGHLLYLYLQANVDLNQFYESCDKKARFLSLSLTHSLV